MGAVIPFPVPDNESAEESPKEPEHRDDDDGGEIVIRVVLDFADDTQEPPKPE